MKRQVSIEEIWDGRFYDPGDMVKAGCGECSGCSDCCKGMGKTIILDPLDVVPAHTRPPCGFPAADRKPSGA